MNHEDQMALNNFGGITRLFPLPNLVFFPGTVQPLHIFEQRYRQLMDHTLEDNRLMSLILLKPGWENDYEGRPELHSMGCIGHVLAEQKLSDGRYNLLLRGLSRFRIIEEVATSFLYRSARIELIPAVEMSCLNTAMKLRQHLSSSILPRFPDGGIRDQLKELFQSELTISSLTDILTYALPIPMMIKQKILESQSIEERAALLVETFDNLDPQIDPLSKFKQFPPKFSLN